jgi:hypothetical protein
MKFSRCSDRIDSGNPCNTFFHNTIAHWSCVCSRLAVLAVTKRYVKFQCKLIGLTTGAQQDRHFLYFPHHRRYVVCIAAERNIGRRYMYQSCDYHHVLPDEVSRLSLH